MAYFRMLCQIEIMQDTARGDHRLVHAVHAEALERGCTEMLHEPLLCGIGRVNPVVHLVDRTAVREILFAELPGAVHSEQLARGNVGQELVDILLLSLSAQEFAGGHVEKGGSNRGAVNVDRGEEIVVA